jgi:hypothetical protein
MNRKYVLTLVAACAALALTQKAGAQLVLDGNTLLLGLGANGAMSEYGVSGPTPTSPFIGLQYDSTGTGNYSKGYDFVTPGNPFQYYSVGVNGNFGFASDGSYNTGNTFGVTTANTSPNASTLQATSSGGSYRGLSINQSVTFQKSGTGSGILAYNVQLQNTTGATLNNVAYSTGVDPDQDVYFDNNYQTANNITSRNYLYATGNATAWTIAIANTSSTYTPTGTYIYNGGWDNGSDMSPYNTEYGFFFGGGGNVANYEDDTLNMAWQLGDLAPGQTVDLTYDYVVAGTPAEASTSVGAPDGASTLGLLGLALTGLGALRRKMKV